MRVFLLDLWLDLREKRLAPVALGLLAALILVPLVLASDEPEPPPPPPVAQQGEDSALPDVKVAGKDVVVASRLTAFDPRDPFEPQSEAQLEATDDTGTTGTTTGGGDTGSGSTGGGETTGGGDTGGGTTTGGGDTGGGTTGGTGGTQQRTTFFTFTVDVTFGEFGEERRRNGVERLEILPEEENPVVVFLGVTSTGRTAVFLVDPGMEATGEGVCRPSRDECTFLYLRDDQDRNTALLTAEDGTVYRLTLRDINRVASDAQGNVRGGDDDGSARGGDEPAFTGSTRDNAPPGEPEDSDDETADRKSSYRSPELAADGRAER